MEKFQDEKDFESFIDDIIRVVINETPQLSLCDVALPSFYKKKLFGSIMKECEDLALNNITDKTLKIKKTVKKVLLDFARALQTEEKS